MDTMHACDFMPFHWPRKEKKEKHKQRLVVSKNLETNFSKKISTIPTYIAKCYSKVCHAFPFKIILLFIVQFKAHGKVAKSMVIIII
jgi:hypothetical protein